VILERVLVVGAGQMGAGIAQVVAASGRAVLLHDTFPGAVDRGLATIERSLGKLHDVLHAGLGDPKYAPCPLLRRHVAAGRLGRKSGRGFYEYG
jgi:3-hydroxyacyl-CoA dehydrogenase